MTVPVDVFTEIYGAAVDPCLWPVAIDRCVDHVGAASAALINIDTIGGKEPFDLSVISDHLRRNITEQEVHYWKTDLSQYELTGHKPWRDFTAQSVYRDLDLWPDAITLDQRPDYQFMQDRFEVRRKLWARLSDNKRYIDLFCTHFPIQIDTVPEIYMQRMSMLVPHVAKAVETGMIFDKLQKQYTAVLLALNHVGIGLCVAESDGTVVVSNHEATRIINSENGIALSTEQYLVCDSEDDTRFLNNCIENFTAPTRQFADAERIISLRSKGNNNNPIIVEVSPLQDQLKELNTRYNLALIQLVDAGCHRHCSVDAFALAYGLTKSESEVAKLILQGLHNNEIADTRNTSLDTAKTQIAKVMRKARVNSRVQLIRLILKTDPPTHIQA